MLDDRPSRPLDEREQQLLRQLACATYRDDPDLAHLLSGTDGHIHPPVRETGTRLRWWVVATVMGLAVLYAGVIVILPEPFALAVVLIVQLVLIPAGCLLWARRQGEL